MREASREGNAMKTKGYRVTIKQFGMDTPSYVVAETDAKAKSLLWYKVSDVVDFGFGDFTSCRRFPALDGRPKGTYLNPEEQYAEGL